MLNKANPLNGDRDRELLKDALCYTYKIEDNIELSAHCFMPEGHDINVLKPTIIFLHGGLWDVSIVAQFAAHCMHFASRGMVAIAVEYRVSSIHNSTAEDSLEDAQAAMLWAKHNHNTMGIDPEQIIMAGAASGAHMALSMAMIPDIMVKEPYSARPMAVIGISPLVDTTKKGIESERFRDPLRAAKNSPSKNIKKKIVPTLLFHGKSDTIVPYEQVSKFAKAMKRKKNNCELIDYEAVNHSFFNFNVSPKHFEITLNSMDAFVVELGCIEPMEYI